MTSQTIHIRGRLGAIPVGAVLVYDGFGHLEMEGTDRLDGNPVHPLTVSVLNGPNTIFLTNQPHGTRYRVMGHGDHLVTLAYYPDNERDVPPPPDEPDGEPASTDRYRPYELAQHFAEYVQISRNSDADRTAQAQEALHQAIGEFCEYLDRRTIAAEQATSPQTAAWIASDTMDMTARIFAQMHHDSDTRQQH